MSGCSQDRREQNAMNRPAFRRFTQCNQTPLSPQRQQPLWFVLQSMASGLTHRPPVPLAAKVVGGYSYDFKSQKIVLGHNECRVLKEEAVKTVERDLSIGVEDYVLKQHEDAAESKAARSSFLRYLLKKDPKFSCPKLFEGVQFVTMRSVLIKIALATRGLRILAVKLAGKIFLCDMSEREWWSMTPGTELGVFVGKNFEKHMTKAAAHSAFAVKGGDSAPGNGEAYYAVFRVQFGDKRKFSLLVSAETDGVDRHGNFVKCKAKCVREFKGPGSIDLKTWMQSYLVGIERMFVGLKDERILKRVVEIKTSEIPPAARWSPEPELTRLQSFLSRLEEKLAGRPNDTWLLASSQSSIETCVFKFLTAAEREPYEHFVPAEVYQRR